MTTEVIVLSRVELDELIRYSVKTGLKEYTQENPGEDEVYITLGNVHNYSEAFKTHYKKNKLKKAILRGELGSVDADGGCHLTKRELREYLNAGRK